MSDAAGRGEEEHDLPDGVIPFPPETREERAGCTVTGCLYLVVVLFALALIALVVGLAVRMWITPALPRM
jgi:hypothetical protein